MKETGLLFAFGSIFLLTLQPAFAEGDGERRISNVVNGVLAANPDLYYKFDAKPLRERMDFYHTPGVSIAVINHGRIEWARGFGVAERDRTNPVTETTLFQAASISKPVFALAVMRLVQDGKLDLDTDVNQYLKSPPSQDTHANVGGVGISFFISGSGNTARFGHGGANAGFRSQMTFYEHEGLGCVVMVNSDEGGALIPEIERAVAREYNWPDYFPKERTEIAVDPKSYDGLVGQYSFARNGTPVMVIHRRADRLMGRLFGPAGQGNVSRGRDEFLFQVHRCADRV